MGFGAELRKLCSVLAMPLAQARAGGRRRAGRGSECYVLGRMRILLSELGLSGACLGVTLEPRAAAEDSEKSAPGQRPHDDSPPSTSVFIFAFVV
ncbi:unnamed protein product [Pieris brassicae]|uniref:Uncharacterized protein n=1 Tax=Pieris brassicae TaxID=7116 RepID=A0A9P0X774_PIEBR|nr:unnamed protein product [Pieris brassicae]